MLLFVVKVVPLAFSVEPLSDSPLCRTSVLPGIETVAPDAALPPEESVIVPAVELSCPLLLKDNGPARVRLPAPVSRARLFRLSVSFESVNLR